VDNQQNRVFVTDPTKHRLHAFDLQGKFLGVLENDPASHTAFTTPLGVGVNKENGLLVVTDLTANKLYRFDSKTAPFTAPPAAAGKTDKGGD